MTNLEVLVVPTREEVTKAEWLVAAYCAWWKWPGLHQEQCSEYNLAVDAAAIGLAYARLAHQTPPATQPSAMVGEVSFAGIFAEPVLHQAQRLGADLAPRAGETPGEWRDRVRLAAILATLHTPPPVATATDEALVDKCAKAMWLCDEHWYSGDTWEAVPDYGQNLWRDRARACLDIAAKGPLATATVVDADVERVARAMCEADGLDPDEEIVGGQATGFDSFGALWQAEEKSEGQLGLTNYARLARAALAATPTPPAGGQ